MHKIRATSSFLSQKPGMGMAVPAIPAVPVHPALHSTPWQQLCYILYNGMQNHSRGNKVLVFQNYYPDSKKGKRKRRKETNEKDDSG